MSLYTDTVQGLTRIEVRLSVRMCGGRPKIKTTVEVTEEDSGTHSKVTIRTRDRPGLLTDIVKTLKDISVNVVSAEVRP